MNISKNRTKKAATKKQRVFIAALVTAGIFAAGLVYAFFAMNGLAIPCFIKALTGFDCPSCGISRTALALLTFRFDELFSYNLIWPVILFYFMWVYFFSVKSYIKKGVLNYDAPTVLVDIAVLVTAIVWWIVRNIMGI